MNSIIIDRAGKRLGQTSVLRDVCFEICRGDAFGIFGRSGSGKSSLLKLISGLDHPSSGSVTLQVDSGENRAWLGAQVGIALQTPGLAPELTIVENLRMFAALWGTSRNRRLGRRSMFIELLGLSGVKNRRVRELPDGLKAAAELARAFVSEAEIIAIDGLIERLDRPTRRRVWEYILARKRQGTTFIIATSSADEAELCDRLAVLSRGRLAFLGTPDDLRSAVQNEIVVVESIHNPLVRSRLGGNFRASVKERDGSMQFQTQAADTELARAMSDMKSDVGCVYLRQPSLDDALDRIEGD